MEMEEIRKEEKKLKTADKDRSRRRRRNIIKENKEKMRKKTKKEIKVKQKLKLFFLSYLFCIILKAMAAIAKEQLFFAAIIRPLINWQIWDFILI
jgi:hypothetical protein